MATPDQSASASVSKEPSSGYSKCFADPSLPIFAFKNAILDAVRENSVVVVVGETGCGKTTQISQFMLDEWLEYGKKKQRDDDNEKSPVREAPLRIGITNPRRVGAVSVARRVAAERGVEVGSEVGFSVRFSDATSDSTLIKYMTDGVLLRECVRVRSGLCVIVDFSGSYSVKLRCHYS